MMDSNYSCGEREPASARRFVFTRADDCFSRFARKSSSLVLAVGSLPANLHQRSPSSEVLGRGVVGRQILLPARPWARVCRMASVMRVAIMPVPPEAPARRYRWSGSIADDAACDQANRACDEGTCECAHRSVSESLLRMCGGRRAGYSRDRDQDRKRFIHVNPPSVRYGGTQEGTWAPRIHCPQFVNKVRRTCVLSWAFAGRRSSAPRSLSEIKSAKPH